MFENQKAGHDEKHVEQRQHMLEPFDDRLRVRRGVREVIGHHQHRGEKSPDPKQPVGLLHYRTPIHDANLLQGLEKSLQRVWNVRTSYSQCHSGVLDKYFMNH